MMLAQTTLFGRIVKRYDIPLNQIDDFNLKYEAHKKNLNSFGPRLAGRLDSELEFTNLLGETKISKTIGECLNDYIDTIEKLGIFNEEKKLHILSCWVNDVKDPHKFKDGQLGFVGVDGIGTTWVEPEVGHFYIFEARHQHCVMPFKTKVKGEVRRSMSFNFINNV